MPGIDRRGEQAMRVGGAAVKRRDWLAAATAGALVAVATIAAVAAVRLALASGSAGDDLVTELRARTARRLEAERDQIRPALEAEARGDAAGARRAAEEAVGRLEANSQLRLLLAGLYRDAGAPAPALREYRRAVELVRDYADRHSPQFIGPILSPWLRQVRPSLSGAALADLHYLERSLAGGCS
jgi:hypothetical protein